MTYDNYQPPSATICVDSGFSDLYRSNPWLAEAVGVTLLSGEHRPDGSLSTNSSAIVVNSRRGIAAITEHQARNGNNALFTIEFQETSSNDLFITITNVANADVVYSDPHTDIALQIAKIPTLSASLPRFDTVGVSALPAGSDLVAIGYDTTRHVFTATRLYWRSLRLDVSGAAQEENNVVMSAIRGLYQADGTLPHGASGCGIWAPPCGAAPHRLVGMAAVVVQNQDQTNWVGFVPIDDVTRVCAQVIPQELGPLR